MSKHIFRLGVDLGGTKMEVIVLDPDNKTLFRQRIATPRSQSDKEYQMILDSLGQLTLEGIQCIPSGQDFTIGIGTPGSLDPLTGLIFNSNITCLNDKSFKHDIEMLLERTVGIQNDANCFTLAEAVLGAGKGYRTVFGVIMGTGCGGGISIDGKIMGSANGIAGEWGHVSIDPDGEVCYCGNKGCIESRISGKGVETAFSSRFGLQLKMEQIVQGYRDGDPNCVIAFRQFLDDFGRAAGGLISVLDPDVIVLGGGLSNIVELYENGADLIRKYAFHPRVKTNILKNFLGDSAGVIGAAWIGC